MVRESALVFAVYYVEEMEEEEKEEEEGNATGEDVSLLHLI